MNKEQFYHWCEHFTSRNSQNHWQKPLIMGILNCTSDSFSDGGLYLQKEKAYIKALELIESGADILDIGAESSRPGAKPISVQEELDRLIPLIEMLAERDLCISVDTYKPQVMQASIEAGAAFINDIYALRQPQALETAARLNVPVCLMHMLGEPQSMQSNPQYPQGLISSIEGFFEERIQACQDAGIKHLLLDPGFGFGKTVEDNMLLMRHLKNWQKYQLPCLLGVSRKSTIGALLNKAVDERMVGGLSLAVYAALEGVSILRTHDVDETSQALMMIERIKEAGYERT